MMGLKIAQYLPMQLVQMAGCEICVLRRDAHAPSGHLPPESRSHTEPVYRRPLKAPSDN